MRLDGTEIIKLEPKKIDLLWTWYWDNLERHLNKLGPDELESHLEIAKAFQHAGLADSTNYVQWIEEQLALVRQKEAILEGKE